jgi:hypothetical protein
MRDTTTRTNIFGVKMNVTKPFWKRTFGDAQNMFVDENKKFTPQLRVMTAATTLRRLRMNVAFTSPYANAGIHLNVIL